MRYAVLAGLVLVAACSGDDSHIYTLYRDSTVMDARIHVATFDATGEADSYNRGNCQMVVKYLVAQPEVPDGYYWCEQGRYRE